MIMQDPTIEGIFSVPILQSFLTRDFTVEELSFFNEEGKTTRKNTSNWTSKNHYVLDDPAMKEIKESLMHLIKYWFEHIACNSSVKPYITQSWLNFTQKEESHHLHNHPNSYLSGVLYISGKDDKISFHKQIYEQIKILPDKEELYNQYNSEMTWFATPPGKILLFPSSAWHSVESKTTDLLRVSLAFNVFVEGPVGKDFSLTALEL